MTPTCPKCGSHTFHVYVLKVATVKFFDDGEHEVIDESGDFEWKADAEGQCNHCQYINTLNHMVGKD